MIKMCSTQGWIARKRRRIETARVAVAIAGSKRSHQWLSKPPNNDIFHNSSSPMQSPSNEMPASPTKTLIEKFNNIGGTKPDHKKVIRVTSNPNASDAAIGPQHQHHQNTFSSATSSDTSALPNLLPDGGPRHQPQPQQHFRPTTLYTSSTLNRRTSPDKAANAAKEPMYATIGSKRMMSNVRVADV